MAGEGSGDLVCLGALAGAFGVRGAVRLKSFCAVPADIARYGPFVTEDGREFALRLDKPIKGAFAAHIDGVTDKEAADALRGTRLYAPRARLPDLDEDEFYHADLIGLAAFDTGGAMLGRVRAVLDYGAGDVIEIARPGEAALLVPFTRAAVPTVDPGAGRLIVDPPGDVEA